jgi:hypothetical protein
MSDQNIYCTLVEETLEVTLQSDDAQDINVTLPNYSAQDIVCSITEEPISCKIEEQEIKVICENGGLIEKFWELLYSYLILEDLTSQVTLGQTDFITENNFYGTSLKVWINGLKERTVTILSDNSFRLSPAVNDDDSVVVEYIKKI